MSRWLRQYRLLFGGTVDLGERVDDNYAFSKPIDLDAHLQSSKTRANAYELTEHHISFKINKDGNKEPNTAEITIYNMAEDTVNYISDNLKNNIAVVLEAGYVGEMRQLFKGIVEKFSDRKEGTDRETKIVCKDGAINITEAVSSRSYRRGTSREKVVNDLAKDLGTPIGKISIADNRPLQGNVAMSGATFTVLSDFLADIDHDFSIQDGALYISPNDKRYANSAAYISEETGLIGSPEPLDMKIKKTAKKTKKPSKKKKEKPKDGIRFKCQLDGTIIPNATVYVKSRRFDEAFRVAKVTHTGDYEGNTWVTEVECLRTSAIIDDEEGNTTEDPTEDLGG